LTTAFFAFSTAATIISEKISIYPPYLFLGLLQY
jgi:hypothetical protein